MGGSASPVRIAPRRFMFSERGGGGQAGSCLCDTASASHCNQSLVLYISPPPGRPYCPVRAGRQARVRTRLTAICMAVDTICHAQQRGGGRRIAVSKVKNCLERKASYLRCTFRRKLHDTLEERFP